MPPLLDAPWLASRSYYAGTTVNPIKIIPVAMARPSGPNISRANSEWPPVERWFREITDKRIRRGWRTGLPIRTFSVMSPRYPKNGIKMGVTEKFSFIMVDSTISVA